MLAFLIASSFVLSTIASRYEFTQTTMTVRDFPQVCDKKGLMSARVTVEDLPEIAKMMREQKIDQAWIYMFEETSYRDYELTIEMVEPSDYRKKFEKHMWLKYGPIPKIFDSRHSTSDLIPLVVPIKKSSSGHNRMKLQGICEKPRHETSRSSGQHHSSSATLVSHPPDSDATLVSRINPGKDRSGRKPPSFSVVPVFNPPPGTVPLSALANAQTGRPPKPGQEIAIPHFTTQGPLSPRGGRSTESPGYTVLQSPRLVNPPSLKNVNRRSVPNPLVGVTVVPLSPRSRERKSSNVRSRSRSRSRSSGDYGHSDSGDSSSQ